MMSEKSDWWIFILLSSTRRNVYSDESAVYQVFLLHTMSKLQIDSRLLWSVCMQALSFWSWRMSLPFDTNYQQIDWCWASISGYQFLYKHLVVHHLWKILSWFTYSGNWINDFLYRAKNVQNSSWLLQKEWNRDQVT